MERKITAVLFAILAFSLYAIAFDELWLRNKIWIPPAIIISSVFLGKEY